MEFSSFYACKNSNEYLISAIRRNDWGQNLNSLLSMKHLSKRLCTLQYVVRQQELKQSRQYLHKIPFNGLQAD